MRPGLLLIGAAYILAPVAGSADGRSANHAAPGLGRAQEIGGVVEGVGRRIHGAQTRRRDDSLTDER